MTLMVAVVPPGLSDFPQRWLRSFHLCSGLCPASRPHEGRLTQRTKPRNPSIPDAQAQGKKNSQEKRGSSSRGRGSQATKCHEDSQSRLVALHVLEAVEREMSFSEAATDLQAATALLLLDFRRFVFPFV